MGFRGALRAEAAQRGAAFGLGLLALLSILFVSGLHTRCGPPGASEGSIPRGEMVRRSLRGSPSLDYLAFVPPSAEAGAPLLVLIHGVAGRAEEQIRAFSAVASRESVVLAAPLFDAEIFHDYQRLGRSGRGPRADAALDRLIAHLAQHIGTEATRFYLFGHSGGAQFAHRYVMAHPGSIHAAAISSAGWYTFPDPDEDYPLGLHNSDALPGLRLDPRAFLRVPLLVTVGDLDVERGSSLRTNAALDLYQGTTRLERAARWAEAMNLAALSHDLPPPATFVSLRGIGHPFREHVSRGGLVERAFQFLFGKSAPESRIR
jgi:pimeloyl-ACP methyl ester carboxylesterase